MVSVNGTYIFRALPLRRAAGRITVHGTSGRVTRAPGLAVLEYGLSTVHAHKHLLT